MQSAPMAIGEAPVHRPLRRLCAGTAGRNRPEPTTAPTFLRPPLAAGARFGACASGSEGLRARRGFGLGGPPRAHGLAAREQY